MKTTAYEACPECGFENTLQVDLEKDGYQTNCAECGVALMLCDECLHLSDGTRVNVCDFRWIDRERGVGTCFRRASL